MVRRGPWWACARCDVAVSVDGLTKAARQGVSAECHYCRARDRELTRDHIVPRSLGGADGVRNIVLCCRPCNAGKAALRSGCCCGKCVWAWRKWGPDGWESLEVWAGPRVVYTGDGV